MSDYADTQTILSELSAEQAAPSVAEGSGEGVAPSQSPEPQAAPMAPREWEVPWNGRAIKAGEQDVLKWASQGYDYSQKMAQFNQERAQFEQTYKPYQEIDNFARQNPEWWAHVEQTYAQRAQIQQQNMLQKLPDEVRPVFEGILKENQEIKQFVSEFQREKQEAQAREADQQLLGLISNLQSKHGIDFNSRDEAGQTLEYRVLEFAREKGINDFEIAFNAYYQPHWEKHYTMRAKEQAVKEMQARRESGLLGKAPAPVSHAAPSRPARNYEEAMQFAKQELGLT